MTSPQHTAEELARLTVLPGFPKAPAGARELFRALSSCVTDSQCTAVIDALLESTWFCPVPADILAAIRSTADDYRQQTPVVRCDTCHGNGYESAEYLVEWRGDGTRTIATRLAKMQAQELYRKDLRINRSMIYTAAEPCSCSLGRQIAAAQAGPKPSEPKRGTLKPIGAGLLQ